MKVSKEQYDKTKPRVETPLNVNVESRVDLAELKEPISELIQAVKDSQITDNTESVIFAIKSTQGASDNKQEAFIKYLGEKIDVLVKTLKEKPTSFEFEMKRNNNGFINTVLVKPIK